MDKPPAKVAQGPSGDKLGVLTEAGPELTASQQAPPRQNRPDGPAGFPPGIGIAKSIRPPSAAI